MTAPVLYKKKFWIVNPKTATNQIKNPTFAHPDFEEDWTAIGAGVTIEETGSEQRWGAYSMKVNPANNTSSGAYHGGLTVANTLAYTFSCYVKGVAGQAMRLVISNAANAVKATTQFTATGYWQRVEVTHTAAENAATYRAKVLRDAVASTAAFYVDGAQFEQASKASTFFDGYFPGCHWTGAIRNSPSARSDNTGLGGELVDLEDYCHVVQAIGLGHGDWNQIMTKMTAGGDMYQTHIRKSRNFSLIVDFIGNSLGEIEAKRDAVLQMLRPDLLSNLPVTEQFGINMPSSYRGHEQRIIRYQGVDVNGVEATNPIDIVCVPSPATLTDTPDLPSYQRGILNFAIPSGLLQGAYQDGKVLDLYANFPAEFIVKRDPKGKWCKWTGSAYASLVEAMPITGLYEIAEIEDGKIISPTGTSGVQDFISINYLGPNDEWTSSGAFLVSLPTTVEEAKIRRIVGTGPNNTFYCVVDVRDPSNAWRRFLIGVKVVGDTFTYQSQYGWTATTDEYFCAAYAPNGELYVGSNEVDHQIEKFAVGHELVGAPTALAVGSGLNGAVRAMAFAPNGDLYIGGDFTDAAYPYICKWDGSSFSVLGSSTDINGAVHSLAFDNQGRLLVGGAFTNAGGNPDADYIARWNGNQWQSIGTGTNGIVRSIVVANDKIYITGDFTSAGGLTLTDRVAVWSNGAWQLLDIDLPGSNSVNSIVPAKDGSLYISGNFSTAGEDPDENAKTGVVALNFDVASASANTYPVISITGPGTLKSIKNYRTGKSIAFDGLTLQAGEWISLNFDPLQLSFRSGWAGRGNLMRYVVAGSDYGDFYVSPGANYLSIFMDGTTTASKASITYVPKFWGLDGALL